MQIYLCVVCATIHACSNTCVAWLFPSHVNLHVTSRVNIDFHGKFWHSAREKLRGATRVMYRVCEVVVELYRSCSAATSILTRSNAMTFILCTDTV